MTLQLHICCILLYIAQNALNPYATTTVDPVMNLITPCTSDVVKSVNNLGSKVSTDMISSPGNVFISPIGLSFALGMAYAGATGRTSEQIEEVMGYHKLRISGREIHEGMRDLCETTITANHSKEYEIFVANGLFVQEEYQIKDDFIDGLEYFYHAETKLLDFNQSLAATDYINEWSRQKTEQKIDPFLSKPLAAATKMILVNAVYFKGTWKVQFPSERTVRDYFYTGRRETTEVMMMYLDGEKFNYYEDLDLKYKFLELPYKGDRVSMILALPLQYDQPADLILDAETLCNVTSRFHSIKLDVVAVPRFHYEFERSLKSDLEAIGMSDAFDSHLANFSGIRDEQDLYLSDVVQKTMVEVDEFGSKAAAVSGSLFMPVAFRQISEFIANHPFIFYIVDNYSGIILFFGKVDEPTGSPVTENLRFR